MHDVVFEQIAPTPAATRDWASALWFAAYDVRAGDAERVDWHGVTLIAAAEVDAGQPRARLAGIGSRGDPNPAGEIDAVVRAARDALARGRRGPQAIDAVVAPASLGAAVRAVFGADAARVVHLADAGGLDGLAHAVRAIEAKRALRVLVLDASRDALAQAALVESATDGSPPPTGCGTEEGCVILPLAHESPHAALIAAGFSTPIPAALEVGLIGTVPSGLSPSELVRSFGLRGTVVAMPAGKRFADVPRSVAYTLMDAGFGTAFLVIAGDRAEVVCSEGIERALAAGTGR